jgi:hypothetical protein
VFNLVKLQDPADVFEILSDHQAEIVLMPFPAESLILSEKRLREKPEPYFKGGRGSGLNNQ